VAQALLPVLPQSQISLSTAILQFSASCRPNASELVEGDQLRPEPVARLQLAASHKALEKLWMP